MGYFTQERKQAACDIETLPEYFLVKFTVVKKLIDERGRPQFVPGKSVDFEMFKGQPLDVQGIRDVLTSYRIITFNGNNYDINILMLALQGADNAALKEASDDIIQNELRSWEFRDKYDIVIPDYLDHIDIFEPAPGVKISLKKYGGRMHMKTIQDLPMHHNDIVKPHHRPKIRQYCGNDVDTTIGLYNSIHGEIEMRERMSDQYDIDLRSKSDAQVAEAVIKKRAQEITGQRIYKDKNQTARGVFNYKTPAFIRFKTAEMNDLLREIETAAFRVNPSTGKVIMPKFLEDRIIAIGDSRFRMGIGGLHSSEQKAIHIADEEVVLIDRDVTSYYPFLILICALFPKAVGEVFLDIFRTIVDERVVAKRKAGAAKDAGDKDTEKFWKIVADSFKILANGSFGKLGSSFSILYAPELLIQVTITGQLAVLMLIESIEEMRIPVVSANTDGVVIKCPREKEGLLNLLIAEWEDQTGLQTEETRYTALYSRDVNNYLAFKEADKTGFVEVKTKGVFAKPGLRKDPANWICAQAVIDFLKDGKPIEDTINEGDDIRDFVTIRAAAGGGEKNGEYLGKTVRWYMGTNSPGPITCVANGNTVSRSEGATPCMTLPDDMPDDLDRDWYIQEAHAILDDLGYMERPFSFCGRTGYALARLPKAKNIHTVDLETAVALCGQRPVSRREPWIEMGEIPDGHRECPRCKKVK